MAVDPVLDFLEVLVPANTKALLRTVDQVYHWLEGDASGNELVDLLDFRCRPNATFSKRLQSFEHLLYLIHDSEEERFSIKSDTDR